MVVWKHSRECLIQREQTNNNITYDFPLKVERGVRQPITLKDPRHRLQVPPSSRE